MLGLVHGVRGDQDAGPAFGGGADRVPQPGSRQRIHAGGRLVEDEQLRLVREGGDKGEAALEAERQVAHELVAHRRELGVEAGVGAGAPAEGAAPRRRGSRATVRSSQRPRPWGT